MSDLFFYYEKDTENHRIDSGAFGSYNRVSISKKVWF